MSTPLRTKSFPSAARAEVEAARAARLEAAPFQINIEMEIEINIEMEIEINIEIEIKDRDGDRNQRSKSKWFESEAVTKLSEIPCRVSSDLHEWRNESATVLMSDTANL